MIMYNQHIIQFFRSTSQMKKCHKEYHRNWVVKNRDKRNEWQRKFYSKNKEKQKERGKTQWKKTKLKVFEFYSDGEIKCRCCGENHIDFLDLDHIYDDGKNHRNNIGSQASVYYWIIRNGFPDGFQILCKNCNISKGRDPNHLCVHEKEILENYIQI